MKESKEINALIRDMYAEIKVMSKRLDSIEEHNKLYETLHERIIIVEQKTNYQASIWKWISVNFLAVCSMAGTTFLYFNK